MLVFGAQLYSLGELGCQDPGKQKSLCPTSMPFPRQSPLGVKEERLNVPLN